MTITGEEIHEFESDDALRHQQHEWVLERIFWGVAAIILLAALLGFLGPGPLSYKRARSTDGTVAVGYYRVARYEAPSELRIRVASGESPVRLFISRAFTDETSLQGIAPEPESVAAAAKGLIYTLQIDPSSKGLITYRYKQASFGAVDFRVGIQGKDPVRLRQYVLP